MFTDKNGHELKVGMVLKHDEGGLYTCVKNPDGEMMLLSQFSGYTFSIKRICRGHQLVNMQILDEA